MAEAVNTNIHKIIKSHDFEKIKKYNSILDEAQKRASNIEEAAKEHAQKIIEEAEHIKKEALHIKDTAYNEGYHLGMQNSQQETANHIINLAYKSISYINQIEKKIQETIISGVGSIIGFYEADEAASIFIKNHVSESVINLNKVTIRSSPKMSRLLSKRLLSYKHETESFFTIEPDYRLDDNDVLIESDLGITHINTNNKLSKLEKSLKASV